MVKVNAFYAINSSSEWKRMNQELLPVLNELIKIDIYGSRYEIVDQIGIEPNCDDPETGVVYAYMQHTCSLDLYPTVSSLEISVVKDSALKIAEFARNEILNIATLRKKWADAFINRIRSHSTELVTFSGENRSIVNYWLRMYTDSRPVDFIIVNPRLFVASDPSMRWPTVMSFGFQKVTLFLPTVWASWLYENRPNPASVTAYCNQSHNTALLKVSYASTDPDFLADMLLKIALGEVPECLW